MRALCFCGAETLLISCHVHRSRIGPLSGALSIHRRFVLWFYKYRYDSLEKPVKAAGKAGWAGIEYGVNVACVGMHLVP